MTHDEMIEAVAEAICKAHKMDCGLPEGEADYEASHEWSDWSVEARAAIRVIAPAVLEEAAKVAPAKIRAEGCETVGQWERRALREAIRAMKTRYER